MNSEHVMYNERASREKYWTERNADEKLEALRSEVLALSYVIRRLDKHMDGMLFHQHAKSGQVVVQLSYVAGSITDLRSIPTSLMDEPK